MILSHNRPLGILLLLLLSFLPVRAWADTARTMTYLLQTEFADGQTITPATMRDFIVSTPSLVNSAKGPIDIMVPFVDGSGNLEGPAIADGSTDNSTLINDALDTGRDVYIPNTAQGIAFCNISLTTRASVYGLNSHVLLPSSPTMPCKYMFQISGTGGVVANSGSASVRGLQIVDTTSSACSAVVVCSTDAGSSTLPSGLTGDVPIAPTTNPQTIVVNNPASGPSFLPDQRIDVLMVDGTFHTDWITGVTNNGSTSTITISRELEAPVNNGATVWASFGLFHVTCGANGWRIQDIYPSGPWTGVTDECQNPGSAGNARAGFIENFIMLNGHMFGIACGPGCSQLIVNNFGISGGFSQTINATYNNGTLSQQFCFGGTWSTVASPNQCIGANIRESVLTQGITVKDTTASITYAQGSGVGTYAFSPDGTYIILNPNMSTINGDNIQIKYLPNVAEGLALDNNSIGGQIGGFRGVNLDIGNADKPGYFVGNLTDNTSIASNSVANSNFGPGGNYAVYFNRVGPFVLSGVELGGAQTSLIATNSVIYGDITESSLTSASNSAGFNEWGPVIDPTVNGNNSYTGDYYTHSSGVWKYSASQLIQAFGASIPTSATGTCKTNAAVQIGSRFVQCTTDFNTSGPFGSATGTLQTGQSSSSGGFPAYAQVIGLISGTDTLMLSNPATSVISSGTMLTFSGPAQPSGNTVGIGMPGLSASIGGSNLAAGACAQGTATVAGATVGNYVIASPNTYPGNTFGYHAYVSTGNTVTVVVCNNGSSSGTPTASTYNVRVIQ